jgi:serine/threonine protein kinase
MGIAQGMNYLHSLEKKIIHRDLKVRHVTDTDTATATASITRLTLRLLQLQLRVATLADWDVRY